MSPSNAKTTVKFPATRPPPPRESQHRMRQAPDLVPTVRPTDRSTRKRGAIAQIDPALQKGPKGKGKIQIEIVLADLTNDPRADKE